MEEVNEKEDTSHFLQEKLEVGSKTHRQRNSTASYLQKPERLSYASALKLSEF